MEQVFEHGGLRVTVEGPDLPEGVEVRVDLDIRAAASEGAARGAIEALGGIGAFEDVVAGWGAGGYLRMKGAGLMEAFEVTLHVPTGREREPVPAPFLSDLRAEQRALPAPEAS